jgi:tyrosyl-DNA phosphodiesterase-1
VDEFGASLNAGRVENGSETKEPRAAGGAVGESSRFSTASPSKESSLGEGPIQLVWPTVSEVRSSLLGYAAGGSIPGNTRNLAKPHVAARLHAWRALGESRKTEPKTETSSSRGSAYSSNRHPYGRERAVPHIKTYTRYALRSDGPPKLAWVFLGSHNLSGAAWGKFEKNQTQLNVRSYELGVLLAPNLVGARNEKSPFCAVAASLASVAPFPDSAVSAASKRFLCLAGARPRKSASDEHRKASTSAVEFRHARCVREWSRGGKKTDDAPLPGDDDDAKKSDDADFDFVIAPLPYPVPPRRYGLRDTPWTIDTVHAEPDVFERTWPM